MSSIGKSLELRMQDMLLTELVDLVPPDKHPVAVRLVDDYKRMTRAIALTTPGSQKDVYASIMYSIDAIKRYLTDMGKPLTRDQVVEGVIACGFRPERPGRTRGDLKKSMGQFLEGAASAKHEIKEINGLVGLWEWDEARFR